MLQSNTTLDKIKKALVKKVIAELKKMSRKEPENYAKFLENYGEILKEGIHYEPELKESIAEVLNFKSMTENKKISLDDYLEKAEEKEIEVEINGKKEKKKEKTIYYIT
jgi:molecular chaperone HtpG